MKKTKDDNRPLDRSKERQLDGGTDLDTTDLDRPANLDRPGGDLIGAEGREYEPTGGYTREYGQPVDPSAADPFIPGTDVASKDGSDFKAEKLSDREKHRPRPKDGPTYEAHQGDACEDHGGSTDPNSYLTEDTSGLQKECKDV